MNRDATSAQQAEIWIAVPLCRFLCIREFRLWWKRDRRFRVGHPTASYGSLWCQLLFPQRRW